MTADQVRDSLEALRAAVQRFAVAGRFEASEPVADPDHRRWAALREHVDGQLAGKQVLDVNDDDGGDAFVFAARGAERVLACLSPDARSLQASSGSEHPSRVEIRIAAWEELDPVADGQFDLVHCRGLLHRVDEPIELLRKLRRMTAPGGVLLICAVLLADPERSEYLRLEPGPPRGDDRCSFVPGRLAFRWLVQSAGFEVEAEFGETQGPRRSYSTLTGYLRARAVQAHH